MDWIAECLTWTPTVIYIAGALICAGARGGSWGALGAATRGALAISLLSWVLRAPFMGPRFPQALPLAALLVMTLVTFLGWIIGDYSRRYLSGEPGQRRFQTAFLATLASVGTVIVSANLGVIILAWAASSVSLHHLLTFYRLRPAAIIVAHKKFLASRMAECLLLAAAGLLYLQWGTLDLTAIADQAHAASALPVKADVATVLLAVAVLLKCAQLPLHGWLIQVMEAPTPVSALLHAGVVNLGGYVLVRLGPLIAASSFAQGLLVVVGGLTAAVAGLVMLTRVTIKVRLAWSTCSQMGFMVMECGLGLYDLALLHLLAHSLYKAHAFLSAGDAVIEGLERRTLLRSATAPSAVSQSWSVLALPIAGGIVVGSALLWSGLLGMPAMPWISMALLACGLATLLWSPAPGFANRAWGIVGLSLCVQAYLGWHWVFSQRLGVHSGEPPSLLSAGLLVLFTILYALQICVTLRPYGAPATYLYDWIYAGLYLDERFTRLTFRLWPARRVPAAKAPYIAPKFGKTWSDA